MKIIDFCSDLKRNVKLKSIRRIDSCINAILEYLRRKFENRERNIRKNKFNKKNLSDGQKQSDEQTFKLNDICINTDNYINKPNIFIWEKKRYNLQPKAKKKIKT